MNLRKWLPALAMLLALLATPFMAAAQVAPSSTNPAPGGFFSAQELNFDAQLPCPENSPFVPMNQGRIGARHCFVDIAGTTMRSATFTYRCASRPTKIPMRFNGYLEIQETYALQSASNARVLLNRAIDLYQVVGIDPGGNMYRVERHSAYQFDEFGIMSGHTWASVDDGHNLHEGIFTTSERSSNTTIIDDNAVPVYTCRIPLG